MPFMDKWSKVTQKFPQKTSDAFILAPGPDRAILSVFSDHGTMHSRDNVEFCNPT